VGYPFDGYWLDIGNHDDYEKASEEYEQIKSRLHLD
jgi:NDP-sugar pyrophosphorylase family protein